MSPTPLALAANLSLRATDGYSPLSDAGQRATAGNGFRGQSSEDFAMLRDYGVTDVRLTIDWSRLLPDLRRVDNDEREHLQRVLDAAENANVAVWACLFEGPLPREFAGEGGWSDDKAAGRWWPRFVEHTAELFGDRLAGWFPMHDPVGYALRHWGDNPDKLPDVLRNLLVGWRDAWRILHGGPPVATSLGVGVIRPANQTVDAAEHARFMEAVMWRMWSRALRDGTVVVPGRMERTIDDLQGSCDINGVAFNSGIVNGAALTDEELRRFGERGGQFLRRTAEQFPDRPLVISAFRSRLASDSDRATVLESLAAMCHDAVNDGVPLTRVHIDPAIDPHNEGGPSCDGLVTRDREVKESAWALRTALTQPRPR